MSRTAACMDAMPELIGRWYDTVLEPDGMGEALSHTRHWLDVDAGYLVGWDRAGTPRLAVISDVIDDKVIADYLDHYRDIDPRIPHSQRAGNGVLHTCNRYMSEQAIARSEFYQDYLLPSGRRHTMTCRLADEDGTDVYLTFYHRTGRDTFTDEQVALARRVTPHIRRALRLRQHTEGLRAAALHGEAALDALDHGVLLMDAQGRLQLANQRAEAWLQQAGVLRVREGKVRAAVASQHEALVEAMAIVLATGVPACLRFRGAPAALADGPGLCCLTLTRVVHSLPGAAVHRGVHAACPPRSHAQILMMITTPTRQRRASVQQIMQWFGLTPAEARLAHALAAGHSIESHALAHAVSTGTVRKQLQAVFCKTGTTRQAELVGLLAVLPSARVNVAGDDACPR
ncbi:MAG: helix-turn-helix transcriptional regulator [Aquabacterium sp.]